MSPQNYVFNDQRFAYPAAYKIGFVQRRTAGSWLLTARYMQGSLYNAPQGAWDSYNLVDCFNTLQASVGGGYSVNFVLWPNDPTDLRDHGLRNLTLNLTVLTVFNYLKTISYEYDDNGNQTGETTTKVILPSYAQLYWEHSHQPDVGARLPLHTVHLQLVLLP